MKTLAKSSRPVLDSRFWNQFSKVNWEKKPLLVKAPLSHIFEFNDEYIFKLLLRYSDRCRKLRDVRGMKLFVDGQRQYEEEVLQILPIKSDRSLLGYHQRMEKMFSDYCLVCDELLQVCDEKWDLLAAFTQQLYTEIGFPQRFSEMGLYLGNYKKTPFGVHVDGCGVFSFPVVGTKKFRLWTPEYVQKNPKLADAQTYNKFLKGSQLLMAQTGDMTYWPSTAWHIAESDGSFNATWSLGVWLDRSLLDSVMPTMNSLYAEKLGELATKSLTVFEGLTEATGELCSLPQSYRATAKAISRITKAKVEDSLADAWLSLVSKYGLKTSPHHPSTTELSTKDELRLTSLARPVLWRKNLQGISYAYDGVLVKSDGSPKIHKLILALNAGQRCKLSKSVNPLKGFGPLEKLLAAGAFVTIR